jgi:hypothetical protein
MPLNLVPVLSGEDPSGSTACWAAAGLKLVNQFVLRAFFG